MFSLVRKKIRDGQLLNLIKKIIDSNWDKIESKSLFETRKAGIPIGNLTSQLFANIYLNELDQFVKHPNKNKSGKTFPSQKYYIRYMDDFLFLGGKKELGRIKEEIKTFLKGELKLELHPKKNNIFPIKNGIDFLGYRLYPQLVKLRKSTVRRFLKRMKKYKKIGQKSTAINQSIQSFLGFAKHADAFRLVEKMELEKYL